MTHVVLDTQLILPTLWMVGLTLAVWVMMFARRIPFLMLHNKVEAMKTRSDAEKIPGFHSTTPPSDNLKNLFELPNLFYLLVVLQTVGVVPIDELQVQLAWIFVYGRIGHSIVHCTFNLVTLRFTSYLVSAGAMWYMWYRFYVQFQS